MSEQASVIVYFKEPGRRNTEETLRLAKRRAETLGIKNIAIASYTGETGAKASEVFEGYNLVVVAGVVGFREPNVNLMKTENRMLIEGNGGKIIHAAHAFGTLGRAVNRKFGAIQVDEIIANVLRLFSQGLKVGCEIACMAVDAGYFRTDEEAIAIGGSGGGADTAIVLQPSNTHTFFETRIREIICKPR
ncbi:MAG: pyruvate kinase alpha/beta domain-containing protein [Candidatus Bathyarchaeia archaeon]